MNCSAQSQSLSLPSSPVGLVAGNGGFPMEFVRCAKAHSIDVHVVAHRGETDPAIEQIAKSVVWVKVGQLGGIIKALVKARVKEVAFVGGIKPTRLKNLSLDFAAIGLLARVRSVRDDALLKAVASEVESHGIAVISPQVFLDRSLARPGLFSCRSLSTIEVSDAQLGWMASKHLGSIDVGQTVVVREGVVVAVEAIEGTDATIRRVGNLVRSGSVVVKTSKPRQDLRLDLPAIGPQTIDSMVESGCQVLIIESERAFIMEPEVVAAKARTEGIVIKVVASPDELLS